MRQGDARGPHHRIRFRRVLRRSSPHRTRNRCPGRGQGAATGRTDLHPSIRHRRTGSWWDPDRRKTGVVRPESGIDGGIGLLTTTGSLIGGADRIPTMWLEDVDAHPTDRGRASGGAGGWMDSTDTGWEVPRCEGRSSPPAPFPQLLGMLGSVTVPGQHPTYMPTWTVMVRNQLPAIRWHRGLRGQARRDLHRRSEDRLRISPSRRANDDLRRPPSEVADPSCLRLKQEWVEGAAWLEESVARAHRWRYGRARSGATCDRIGPRLFLAGDAHGPVPGTVGASLASAACAVDRILTDVLMRPGLAFLESGWQPVTELAEVGE